jgi:hypothetical protein
VTFSNLFPYREQWLSWTTTPFISTRSYGVTQISLGLNASSVQAAWFAHKWRANLFPLERVYITNNIKLANQLSESTPNKMVSAHPVNVLQCWFNCTCRLYPCML